MIDTVEKRIQEFKKKFPYLGKQCASDGSMSKNHPLIDCLTCEDWIRSFASSLISETKKEERLRIEKELLSIGKRYTDNRKSHKTDNFVILGRRLDTFLSSLSSK